MINDIINVFRVDKAFALIAGGYYSESFDLCDKSFHLYITKKIKLSPSVLESLLLRSHILIRQGNNIESRKSLIAYFKLRKKLRYFNVNEQHMMNAYALGMVWIQRGENQNSCVMAIRQSIPLTMAGIRETIRQRYGG